VIKEVPRVKAIVAKKLKRFTVEIIAATASRDVDDPA